MLPDNKSYLAQANGYTRLEDFLKFALRQERINERSMIIVRSVTTGHIKKINQVVNDVGTLVLEVE